MRREHQGSAEQGLRRHWAYLLRSSSSTPKDCWPLPHSDLSSLESAMDKKKRPISSTPGSIKVWRLSRKRGSGSHVHGRGDGHAHRQMQNTFLIQPVWRGWPKGLSAPSSAPGLLIESLWQQAQALGCRVPNPCYNSLESRSSPKQARNCRGNLCSAS